MQTFKFEPAIGQRYVRRQQGAPNAFFIISAITALQSPTGVIEVILDEELSTQKLRRSLPALAQQILDGSLTPEYFDSQAGTSSHLALNDLLSGMSLKQFRRFKERDRLYASPHGATGSLPTLS